MIDEKPVPLDYATHENSYYGIVVERWLRNNGMSSCEDIVDIVVSLTPEGDMELQIEVSNGFNDVDSHFYYIKPAKMVFKS